MFTVSASNATASGVRAGLGQGEPYNDQDNAGIATKVFSATIPGRKFGRSGVIRYENGSVQVKFYDYVPVFVVYDWLGTLQDTNIVGKINEGYSKIYFKDA